MSILFGIIIILLSVLNIMSPETGLRFQDMFRINGKREYSSFAISMTRFGGFVGVIIGIAFMFTDIF